MFFFSWLRARKIKQWANICARRSQARFRPQTELLEDRLAPAIITVTGTGDTIAMDGVVTLREAITAANTNAPSGDALAGDVGLDIIRFNIPGTGVHTIQPATALPSITDPVTIDGYSQPGASPNSLAVGNNAVLLIELGGSNLTSGSGFAPGLFFNDSSGSTIRGLVINSFPGAGIFISNDSDGTVIEGNFIGTDATGTVARPNGIGIQFSNSRDNRIGGTTPAARNVISGNKLYGILLNNESERTLFQGNYIGTTASGNEPLPNQGDGIRMDNAINNRIGGTAVGSGNVIAFNAGAGVAVSFPGTVNNLIRGNSIFGNAGLGIDLGENGLTANDPDDADTGPNNLQNFPVLVSVSSSAGTSIITGVLNSTPNRIFLLDFYASPEPDPSGLDEGKNYLGAATVTTDSNGNATFTVSFSVSLPAGQVVTATATTTTNAPYGDTSELSPAVSVVVVSGQPSEPTTVDIAKEHGLYSNGNLFVNWGGRNEKWFQGKNNNWYFVLPGGALHLWDRSPTAATGQFIANLPTSFYLNDGLNTKDRAADLDKRFGFTAEQTIYLNWGGLNEKWFQGTGGKWFFITPNGDLFQWSGSGTKGTQIAALGELFYQHTNLVTDAQAIRVDRRLNLHSEGNLYFNWGGRNEKWVQGFDDVWYYLLQDGSIWRWNGTNGANGTIVDRVGADFYQNISKLYNAFDSVFSQWESIIG